MYNNQYEEYMRSVLGYNAINPMNNTYIPEQTPIPEDISLYPEIYKIIYPMVCKACENNFNPITREILEEMTKEIYLNVEITENEQTDVKPNMTLKNGDVRNPNVKEIPVMAKPKRENMLLKDLIRILLLRRLQENKRPPMPPPPPARYNRPMPPPYGQMPDDIYYRNNNLFY